VAASFPSGAGVASAFNFGVSRGMGGPVAVAPVTLGPVTLTITYGLLEPTDYVSGWQLQAALTGAQAGDHLSLLPVEGLTIGESTVTERGVTVATFSRPATNSLHLLVATNVQAITLQRLLQSVAFSTASESPHSAARSIALRLVKAGENDPFLTENRTIEVSPLNDLIELATPTDVSFVLNAAWDRPAAQVIALDVADAEATLDQLTIAATSDRPELFAPADVQTSFTEGVWRVSLRPLAGQFGAATITLVAADPEGANRVVRFAATVSAPPRLVASPTNVTVGAGAPVQLAVTVTGSGPFTYQWQRNGAPVVGANQATLTLPAAEVAQAGVYRVNVANDHGAVVSAPATVSVLAQPTLVSSPVTLYRVAGTAAAFEVNAGGAAPLGYQWLFNGEPADLAALGATANGSRLEFAGVSPKAAGAYQVLVTNAVGMASSPVAFLVVNPTGLTPVAWGDNSRQQGNFGPAWTNVVAVAAGEAHTVGLRADGSIVQAGQAGGLGVVPENAAPAVAVAAGSGHSLALRADGTVVAWGNGTAQQTLVPPGLSNVIQIVAGDGFSAALTADGKVVTWGSGLAELGRGNPPALRRLAAGRRALLGISRAGAVVQLGGEVTALSTLPNLGGDSIQDLAVGEGHALALTAAGNVVAWGGNDHGESIVPANLPAGAVSRVAAGWYHSLALLQDGTVRAWGAGAVPGDNQWPAFGQSVVPSPLAAFQVAGGSYATVVLREAAPVIRVDLADAHCSAGDSVRLEVTADGSAPLTYSWFREGDANPLANAHGPALELANLGGAGSGRYYVVVRNRAGEVSSRRAELVFDEPPSITGPLALDSARTNGAGPLVLVGDSPTLRLTVQGSAPLGFFWQRDGALVSQTAVPNLTLASVTAAHAGSYRVVVSNTFGAVTSAPVVVTVNRAPAIVKMTAPLELLVRSPLQLAVEAVGDAPLSYQWRLGVNPIPAATNATFALPAVTAADAGAYAVTIQNPFGSVTTNVAVTVLVPPTLANPAAPVTPQDRTAGASYALTAQPVGTGPFDFQWFRNGEPIEGATDATYSVPSLTAADEGEYSVRVRSAIDEVTTVIDRVNVVPVPVIRTSPASVLVALGGSATLTVEAIGEGTLSYQWRRRLPDASVVNVGGNQASLLLSAVAPADAGAYFVTVANAAGAVNSADAVVAVVTPPALTASPVGGTFNVGDAVTLAVEFTGTTPLGVQWFKDGAEIPGAIAPQLLLPPVDVRGDLQGSYTVRVSNSAGAVTSAPAIVLTRTAPRLAEFGPRQLVVAPGQPIVLNVVAFGNGLTDASYRWFHEATELAATGPTLTVAAATEADAGFYKVIVSNADGAVESPLASVRVAEIPTITGQPVGQNVPLGAAFELSVTATGLGPLTYQWTLDGIALPGARSSTYAVAAAEAAHAGAYRVTVGNLNGSVTSAEAEITLARRPVITQQPKDVLVTEGDDASFSVTVQVEAAFAGQTTYQWLVDGTPLAGGTNATLNVPAVVWRPGGQSLYTVQVSNPSGRVASSAAVLKVQRSRPLAASATTRTVQGVTLKPGWNAIYLTVLPEQPYIEEALRSVPWSSVWTWKNRRSTVQFIQEMSETAWNQSDWLVRFAPVDAETNSRPEVFANSLVKFIRNAPYLIHVDGTNTHQLQFVGEPGYDRPIWAADSYNLTGFPLDSTRGPVKARDFLAASPALWDAATGQPRALYRLNADGLWFPVGANDFLAAGEAYWAYSKGANDYVAPLELTLDAGTKVDFGPIVNRRTVVLRNRTANPARVNLTLLPPGDLTPTGAAPTNAVTATNVVNAPVPAAVATIVPLTIRQVTLNGNEAVPLRAATEFNVPAGGELELRLEPVRAQVPATGWGNLLTFTDGLGTRHQVPVTVETTVTDQTEEAAVGTSSRRLARAGVRRAATPTESPLRGLWLGRVNLAGVSEVNGFEVTKTVTKFINDEGKETNVVSLQYTAKQGLTAPTPTAAPLELKVLVHIDAAGKARLLSEAYLLFDDRAATTETPGKFVLISDRRRLADFKGVGLRDGQRIGRRLSAVAFKFDGAAALRGFVDVTGSLVPGGSGIAEFGLSADSPVNPFKHRYHPDHDNLGLDFKTPAAEGSEVYSFTRRVTLALSPLPAGNVNLAGTDQLEGTYTEILSGLHRNPIQTGGPLVLQRVSPVAQLNPQ
jgi:alpha-tubulin suppressor-like RCC1 family protein